MTEADDETFLVDISDGFTLQDSKCLKASVE
jgi:hypothetical protein